MKVRSLGVLICGHMRRRLLRFTIIHMIVGLIAFYPLAACKSLPDVSGASAIPTTMSKATPTPQVPVWSDEFNGLKGSSPDPNKWTPKIGGEGWGNQQLDYDTNNLNAYQDGQGNLVLEARKDDAAKYHCWYGSCQYTSAQITTSGHFSFTYGLLEASIKIPNATGPGIWSAFWMLGDNCATVGWPTCGEIDVMENISREPVTIQGTIHGPNPINFTAYYKQQHGTFADKFHVFALQWDPSNLYFFVDGINYATFNKAVCTNQAYWVFDHPFNIVLSLPIGGWAGTPHSTDFFPQKMYVDYVRLYAN